MNSNLKRLVSLIGMVLSVLGFYVKSAASFPAIQAIMAPQYVAAKRAIERLEQTNEIEEGQPDFWSLASLIEDQGPARYPAIPPSGVRLERMTAAGGGVSLTSTGSSPYGMVMLDFHERLRSVQADLYWVKGRVEALWDARSLSWSLGLFWVGIVLTATPTVMDMLASRRKRIADTWGTEALGNGHDDSG